MEQVSQPGRTNRAKRTREEVPDRTMVRELARFRYALRKFLRFSEEAARSCGVTPQQHQLMLGVAGFSDKEEATASELAEFLQERLHSVVGLVERAEQSGLVHARKSEIDRRVLVVTLTQRGNRILSRLAQVHQEQARNLKQLMNENSPKKAVTSREQDLKRKARVASVHLARTANTSERTKFQ